MPDRYTLERIENWVGDFASGEVIRTFPSAVQEHAQELLTALLSRACDLRGSDPSQLSEAELKAGLLEGAASVMVTKSVRVQVPALCGAFLGELEREGRLAGGRSLGRFVKALGRAYDERASGSATPARRPGPKIGLNDPCPCGSGVKFKKCCRGMLG